MYLQVCLRRVLRVNVEKRIMVRRSEHGVVCDIEIQEVWMKRVQEFMGYIVNEKGADVFECESKLSSCECKRA